MEEWKGSLGFFRMADIQIEKGTQITLIHKKIRLPVIGKAEERLLWYACRPARQISTFCIHKLSREDERPWFCGVRLYCKDRFHFE